MTIINPPYLNYIEHGINTYIHQSTNGKRRYIDWFFSLNCAGDLLNLKVFPDAKEVTETMAVYNATRKQFRKKIPMNEHKIVHVVADGSTPRTAAFLAFLTKWQLYSIDPQMKEEWVVQDKVERLKCYKNKIEDIYETLPTPDLVILVHPHVTYEVIKECYPNTPIIAMPCCVHYPEELASKVYRDQGVWSPQNKILIYR